MIASFRVQRRISIRRIFNKQTHDVRATARRQYDEPHQLRSAAKSDSRSHTAAHVRRPRLPATAGTEGSAVTSASARECTGYLILFNTAFGG